jgi:hypothetical protein
MWRTRDGYTVVMPRFRVRRMQRRLRTRYRDDPAGRALSRTLDLLLGRARRSGARERLPAYPVFRSQLGLRPLVILTRTVAPRRVEVLYIGHASRR